jgi:phosphatidylserine/phosphatidylglycerophosphate/cardiolipin synthase-like enzyme
MQPFRRLRMNVMFFRTKIFLLLGCILLITGFIPNVSTAEKSGQSDKCNAVILVNEEFLPALLKAIDKAQNEIMMSIFSFKTGGNKNSYPDRIVSHLAKAVKRGVKVFLVLETSDGESNELDIQNRKAGRFLEKKGIKVYFDSPRKTTHTKLTVIDQRLVFLGSHNFTQSALKYNNEISVLLDSPDIADNARNYILKIIKEGR